ncbi:MAG: histidinol-phosphatase [Thermoguttaceae bacterium]|jgi:histidinol phosphatase-like enzyme (inositol monophosphatase family)
MSLDPSEIKSRLLLALQASREAGQLTLEYFRREDLAVDRKGDDSPVTAADRRAEEHLRNRIAGAFAADAILGEEMADRPGTGPFRWILDPIDGTKSFIHGVPLYGTLVGVEHEGEPLIGVIRIPALDECVYAARGQGAWYVQGQKPPRPAKVSQRASLAQGLFLTSEVATFDEIGRRGVYDRLQKAARLSRSWGDCYGYLMVATGRAELMVDPVVAVWDLAPLLPILEEAGGTFTDWQGRRTIHSGQGIATNGRILEEVLAMVAETE